jgi:hypothetical protein
MTALTYAASQQEMALLIFFGGLLALLTMVNLVTGIWEKFRKKPSHGEDLASFRQETARTFATKSELASAEERVISMIASIKEERREYHRKADADMQELRRLVDQGFKEAQRVMGRLEGKLEHCPSKGCQ